MIENKISAILAMYLQDFNSAKTKDLFNLISITFLVITKKTDLYFQQIV